MIEVGEDLPLHAETQKHRAGGLETRLQEFDSNFLAIEFVSARSQVDPSHSPFTEQLEQLICTHALPSVFDLRNQRFCEFANGFMQEVEGLSRRLQERLDVTA